MFYKTPENYYNGTDAQIPKDNLYKNNSQPTNNIDLDA